MIASGRAAFSTLTRLPVGATTGGEVGAGWFGVVGAALGAAGFVPIALLGPASPTAAAILALAVIAILTGALHLDGLADTVDALLAMGPDAAERARKDPSIGAGGATALILVLGLEVASLASVNGASGATAAALAFLVAGATSRAVPVVLAVAPGARTSSGGLAGAFVARVRPVDAMVAVLTAAVVGLAAAVGQGGPQLVAAGLVGLVLGVGIGLAIARLRGQLDGDGLGASVELGFAATVLAMATIGRWPAA